MLRFQPGGNVTQFDTGVSTGLFVLRGIIFYFIIGMKNMFGEKGLSVSVSVSIFLNSGVGWKWFMVV